MGTWTPTDYNPDDFANRRHIGPSPAEMAEMLKAVGVDSLEALIDQTVPAGIRQAAPLDWVAKPYTWLSPRPDPLPNSLVVKNGSNTWARVASSMPAPLSATAIMTSGTPWPRASGAKRWISGPYSRPPTTGITTKNPRPSQGRWALPT